MRLNSSVFTLFSSLLTAGIVGLSSGSFCSGGDIFRLHGSAGCNCGSGNVASSHVASGHVAHAMYPAPVAEMYPLTEDACACSALAASCCVPGGIGGGMIQLGNLYGSGNLHSSGEVYGHQRSPAPGSFLSGYEGLPNMDGGGIHHRYPYHSYRRPWAHPGTPSTNVTIVW